MPMGASVTPNDNPLHAGPGPGGGGGFQGPRFKAVLIFDQAVRVSGNKDFSEATVHGFDDDGNFLVFPASVDTDSARVSVDNNKVLIFDLQNSIGASTAPYPQIVFDTVPTYVRDDDGGPIRPFTTSMFNPFMP